MTNWDVAGDYEPPLVNWPPPEDDPDTEPDEGWARDAEPSADPEP